MKMNFIQVELGLGLLIAKTDLPCLFKRLRGPAPMHPEGLKYCPRKVGGPASGTLRRGPVLDTLFRALFYMYISGTDLRYNLPNFSQVKIAAGKDRRLN